MSSRQMNGALYFQLASALFWALVVLLILGFGIVLLSAQSRSVTLAIGRVAATEQESQECVFPIGQGAAVLLHPKGEPCVLARGLIGKTGRLVFVLDETAVP